MAESGGKSSGWFWLYPLVVCGFSFAIKSQKSMDSSLTKSESLEVLPPTKEVPVTPCRLVYHKAGFSINVPKEQIFKHYPGYIIAVTIQPSQQDQEKLKTPEFLVFQVRINEMFEFEQVGSGFPCKDESKAKEVAQLIISKNQKVPFIMLASWRGGFALVEMKNQEAWYDELVLFCYHEPKKIGDELSKFSLRHFKRCLGKPPELTKEEMLPTTDPAVAEGLFQQENAKIKAEESAKQKPMNDEAAQNAKESAALKESQLIVLSKAFPETIQMMRSGHAANPADAYAAYKRDIFALTGKMDEPITIENKEQFLKMASPSFKRNRKRKKVGIDPLEYELVVGWFFRGYGSMTPENRRDALKARGIHDLPSAEVIRHLCRKLKLPSLRKSGRH